MTLQQSGCPKANFRGAEERYRDITIVILFRESTAIFTSNELNLYNMLLAQACVASAVFAKLRMLSVNDVMRANLNVCRLQFRWH